jgi:hypothetical protein
MPHIIDSFGVDLTATRERESAILRALMSEERFAASRRDAADIGGDDDTPEACAAWLAADAAYRAVRALVDERRTRAIAAEVAELEAGGTEPALTLGAW